MIDRASLRAYLDRPWKELADETDEHRAKEYRRDPEWTWRTAQALRAAVAKANPNWPTDADRAADLAHHLELRALLDRVAHAFTRRRRAR